MADPSPIEVNADSRGKKPVWNVPAASNNGTIEVGPVVDAMSWPALSKSTKSSSDSLKSLSDSGPLISSSPSPKAVNSNRGPNPEPNINHVENQMPPTHQKPIKLGNSSSSSSNHLSQQPVTTPEPSSRGSSIGGNEQHRVHNNGIRRGTNGGGGSNQNHGNREWNRNRNNPHMHRGGFRAYSRQQPPFVAPPSLPRHYAGNAMGFSDLPSPMYYVTPQQYPEALRAMPFVPHPVPHAMFFPSLDPQRATLLKQIDYYFSSENLCKDIYLRSHMDEQGWVPISLIAGFNKVKSLTNNIQYILDTVRFSTFVETQGDKIRRRNDWMSWLVQPQNHLGSASNPQSPTASDYNAVTTQLQNVNIDGATANINNHTDVVLTRSVPGNLNNQFPVIGESARAASGQFTGFFDSRSLLSSDTF